MLAEADKRWPGVAPFLLHRDRYQPDHDRRTAAEREFLLDQILTDLWKGRLTREIAIGRIMAKLGLNQRAARDKVDGFLRIEFRY
jgi:hypothetical protein